MREKIIFILLKIHYFLRKWCTCLHYKKFSNTYINSYDHFKELFFYTIDIHVPHVLVIDPNDKDLKLLRDFVNNSTIHQTNHINLITFMDEYKRYKENTKYPHLHKFTENKLVISTTCPKSFLQIETVNVKKTSSSLHIIFNTFKFIEYVFSNIKKKLFYNSFLTFYSINTNLCILYSIETNLSNLFA